MDAQRAATRRRAPGPRWLVPGLAVATLAGLAIALVVATVRQPALPSYAPTPAAPRDVGPHLVGPVLYTVDATDPDAWRYFSFRLGAVVENPAPGDWDLAFRRHQIIANGGRGFQGQGGILDLGPVAFDEVQSVPTTGYQATERTPDPRNAAIEGWYRYGFFSHVLTPRPHVWAVRTADGRYAKMEILGYYCPGRRAGCLTFRYVYQGDGSPVVAPPR